MKSKWSGILLLCTGLILGLIGGSLIASHFAVKAPKCSDSAIIWSAESQSPDKHYIASARTEQFGGLGTAAVFTAVYLKQSRQPPAMILSLSNESAYPLGITAVDMTWITPSHLSIIYRGQATINFQAIKCAGVEISVEKKEK